MDPDLQTVVAYLCDRLNPDEKAELEQLLGGAVPDVAEDALHCRRGLSFDRLPERLKRNKSFALRNGAARMAADAAASDEFAKQFPNADRLK